MFRRLAFILLSLFTFVSLQNNSALAAVTDNVMDKKVQPCDDFYQFACGGWLATTEIPADRPKWSRGFAEIDERNKKTLREILEGYSSGKKTPESPYVSKLGDFYSACMDEKVAEGESLKTLAEKLKRIDQLKNLTELPKLLATLHLEDVNALFGFGEEPDFKDPNQVIGIADQGGLGLPDRDYYLKSDSKMREIRTNYEVYVAKMFEMLGEKPEEAKTQAKQIMVVENALAKASMDRTDRREPSKIYHRLERLGLKEKTPSFDWDVYFKELGYGSLQAINVANPEFFASLNAVLQSTSLPDLKTYLKWHLIDVVAPALPIRFVDERFRFSSKNLSGQKELPPRWKRCVQATDAHLGFALGRAYVQQMYGEGGKAASKTMIKNIEDAFLTILEKLDWMDDKTKVKAKNKLSKIFNKIGYPDKWRNYDKLSVIRKSYVENLLEAKIFLSKYDLDKIGKPLDRTEWSMTPSTVNAYYSSLLNEMVFPAGIMQPPFFAKDADVAGNFGAIGMVMGHELTHGFDDKGRKFDADGSLTDWWTPKVAKEFEGKAECLVKQYESYTVQDLHLNGKLTLGENIADQGGLKLAYQAWVNSLGEKKAPVVNASQKPGYTEDQQFFIGFAQAWCAKAQPQLERMLVTVDPHSPDRYRVNGTVSNFPKFAEAFSCKSGSKMAPKNHCSVW